MNKHRARGVLTFLGLCFAFYAAFPAVMTAQGVTQDTAILVTNSVFIKKDAVINGTVVVNDVSPGPFLDAGVHASIDKASIAGADRRAVIAPTVDLDKDAVIQHLCVDTVVQDKGAIIGFQGSYSNSDVEPCDGTPPIFTLPPFETGVPGAMDLNVPAGTTLTVPNPTYPGREYNNVTVGANATLTLDGSGFSVASITIGQNSKLLFDSATKLRVAGRLSVGKLSEVGPAPTTLITASEIQIFVAGENGDPFDPNSTPKAAAVDQQSEVSANFYVPNGTFEIGRRFQNTGGLFTGAVIARDVIINKEVTVNADSAVANQPPTAIPQLVVTDGTQELGITLEGTDPEGEVLTFLIVSGPFEGGFSNFTQVPPSNATVTYTAALPGDLVDSFTFRVTDPGGLFDEAVVDINLNEQPPPEPLVFTGNVMANDRALETVTGAETEITLTAFADIADPSTAGDFEFSIVSGPTPPATLTGLTQVPPAAASVTYLSPNSGSDSFVFRACADLSAPLDGDTLDPGECDTATVLLTVNTFTPPPPPEPPVAQNIDATTPENAPAEIDLATQVSSGDEPPRQTSSAGGASVMTSRTNRVARASTGPSRRNVGVPNLDITAFSAPACASLSEVVGDRIQVTLTNTGDEGIPAGTLSSIGFYVSADATITTGDTLLFGGRENLATSAPNGLPAGQSISNFLFAGASIDALSPTGNVYIGAVADEGDTIAESDEADNTASQAIEIRAAGQPGCAPDLTVTLGHAPVDPFGFQALTFTAVVKNEGADPAGQSTLCLINGAAGEDCADQAARFLIPPLPAGAQETVVRTENVAVGGPYQNVAVADIDDVVAESNEGNNTAIDAYSVVATGTRLVARIEQLPAKGTLEGRIACTTLGPPAQPAGCDDPNPVPISAADLPVWLRDTTVIYVPDPLPQGVPEETDSFQYTLFDTSTGLTSSQSIVNLTVTEFIDQCLANGRDVGCAPGP